MAKEDYTQINSEFFELLKKTIKLDVFDANHQLCSENKNIQGYYDLKKFAKIRYVSCMGNYIRILAKGILLGLHRKRAKPLQEGGIALVSNSGNNTVALEPIKSLYPNLAYFIGPSPLATYGPSIYAAAWVSLFFFPIYLWKCLRASAYEKRSLSYALDQVLLSYGYYYLSCFWLKKYKPRLVVFANDHSFHPRTFRAASLDVNVKTLYIQHASVTANFPPLDFDYACLDGKDSLEQYRQAGSIQSTVFLIGMAKSSDLKGFQNRSRQVN
nr:hypothetical protein [Spirochaetales bacterium]